MDPQPELPHFFTDSELLKVQIKPSQIQGSGLGLFAAQPISQGQYIAEYYGTIISEKYSFSEPFLMEDKMVYINPTYCVISRSPASRANDIISWQPEQFMKPQNQIARLQKQLPLIEDKYWNARLATLEKDKAFVVATRQISAGQEIYISYGYDYWQFFFKAYLENKNAP